MSELLSLKVRENKGRLALQSLLPRFSRMLEAGAIEVLPLPATDKISAIHRSGYQRTVGLTPDTFRVFYNDSQAAELHKFLVCFLSRIEDQSVYCLLKQSEYCGAFVVPLSSVLTHFRGVIEEDGDSMNLLAKDEMNGMMLDWNDGDTEVAYELALWGAEWGRRAQDCAKRPG